MAGGPGFEPRLPGSEPGVLPLNYPPSFGPKGPSAARASSTPLVPVQQSCRWESARRLAWMSLLTADELRELIALSLLSGLNSCCPVRIPLDDRGLRKDVLVRRIYPEGNAGHHGASSMSGCEGLHRVRCTWLLMRFTTKTKGPQPNFPAATPIRGPIDREEVRARPG